MIGERNADRGALTLEARTGAGKAEHMQSGMFPFDAFEFDSPERTETPEIRIRAPWRLVVGRVRLTDLPTEDTGLVAGELWNDSGTVRIV